MARKRITPSVEKSMKTRQAIYHTAMTLFSAEGYDMVTVDEICREVGVTKGAFYHYFRSKDQILREKFMEIDDFCVKTMEDVSDINDILDKIRIYTRAFIKYVSDQGLMLNRIVYHAELGPDTIQPFLTNRKSPAYTNLLSLYREGQERGQMRADLTSEEMALMAIHFFRGLIYDWCLTDGAFDLVEAGDTFLDILNNGLCAR